MSAIVMYVFISTLYAAVALGAPLSPVARQSHTNTTMSSTPHIVPAPSSTALPEKSIPNGTCTWLPGLPMQRCFPWQQPNGTESSPAPSISHRDSVFSTMSDVNTTVIGTSTIKTFRTETITMAPVVTSAGSVPRSLDVHSPPSIKERSTTLSSVDDCVWLSETAMQTCLSWPQLTSLLKKRDDRVHAWEHGSKTSEGSISKKSRVVGVRVVW